MYSHGLTPAQPEELVELPNELQPLVRITRVLIIIQCIAYAASVFYDPSYVYWAFWGIVATIFCFAVFCGGRVTAYFQRCMALFGQTQGPATYLKACMAQLWTALGFNIWTGVTSFSSWTTPADRNTWIVLTVIQLASTAAITILDFRKDKLFAVQNPLEISSSTTPFLSGAR